MDSLIAGPGGSKRPVFLFEVHEELSETTIPTGQLALSGPSEKLDAAHWPVRGDLAHIRLAGRCFVPHYAVPQPHTARDGALLRAADSTDADAMAPLSAGTVFNVLDIAGGWAWGQVGEDGLVGYVALDQLGEA
jgi:hypothetical protein